MLALRPSSWWLRWWRRPEAGLLMTSARRGNYLHLPAGFRAFSSLSDCSEAGKCKQFFREYLLSACRRGCRGKTRSRCRSRSCPFLCAPTCTERASFAPWKIRRFSCGCLLHLLAILPHGRGGCSENSYLCFEAFFLCCPFLCRLPCGARRA